MYAALRAEKDSDKCEHVQKGVGSRMQGDKMLGVKIKVFSLEKRRYREKIKSLL